jgi:HK97 gp10 family phage protein
MPLPGTGSYVEIFPEAAKDVIDTPEMRQYLGDVAGAGAKFAASIAPVLTEDRKDRVAGAYRDSIDSTVVGGDVPQAVVEAGTEYWRYVEFGTVHNRPWRVLSQALQYMSDRQDWDRGGPDAS